MKRKEWKGSWQVFVFTLCQTLKSKSYRIFLCITLLLSMLVIPVLSLVMAHQPSDDEEEDAVEVHINQIYWQDETAKELGLSFSMMGFDLAEALTGSEFEGIVVETIDCWDYEASLNDLKQTVEEQQPEAIVLQLAFDEFGLTVHGYRSGNGEVTEEETAKLTALVYEQLDAFRRTYSGLSEEQLALVEQGLSWHLSYADENNRLPEETEGEQRHHSGISLSDAQYWVTYGGVFLIMMVNCVAGAQVASAIVTDKATRVVEYLLITVRPLALLIGKVFAMMVASVGQILLVIGVTVGSNSFTTKVLGVKSALSGVLPSGLFAGMKPLNVLATILVVILGFIFYGFLAGLCGATVSKMEEIQEGLTLFTMANVIGTYLAVFASGMMMDSMLGGFGKFAMLFPLSSSYLLPGMVLAGTDVGWLLYAAIAVLLVVDILLIRFTASVYESMITHMGNRIPLKALLGFGKKGGKHEA